ncbi:MAG: hypothetical protein U0L83_01035 [Muribaculaceae bacterium]|nr:hypothetical protein [Muribaculaceae bacterium]
METDKTGKPAPFAFYLDGEKPEAIFFDLRRYAVGQRIIFGRRHTRRKISHHVSITVHLRKRPPVGLSPAAQQQPSRLYNHLSVHSNLKKLQ